MIEIMLGVIIALLLWERIEHSDWLRARRKAIVRRLKR
jgi:hypothetical protein